MRKMGNQSRVRDFRRSSILFFFRHFFYLSIVRFSILLFSQFIVVVFVLGWRLDQGFVFFVFLILSLSLPCFLKDFEAKNLKDIRYARARKRIKERLFRERQRQTHTHTEREALSLKASSVTLYYRAREYPRESFLYLNKEKRFSILSNKRDDDIKDARVFSLRVFVSARREQKLSEDHLYHHASIISKSSSVRFCRRRCKSLGER